VANAGDGTVSVIDTDKAAVTMTLALGAEAQPAAIAISPDGPIALVACHGDNTLRVIDTASNTIARSIPVGKRPVAIAVAPDGRRIYVANAGDGTGSVVD